MAKPSNNEGLPSAHLSMDEARYLPVQARTDELKQLEEYVEKWDDDIDAQAVRRHIIARRALIVAMATRPAETSEQPEAVEPSLHDHEAVVEEMFAEQADSAALEADYTNHDVAQWIAGELPSGWSSNIARFVGGGDLDVDELLGEIQAISESKHVTEQAKRWASWLVQYVEANTNEDGELRGGAA